MHRHDYIMEEEYKMRKDMIVIWTNKLIRLFSVLVAVSLISFILMAYSPLDPLTQYIGGESAVIGEQQKEKIAKDWGFDQSCPEQYVHWITGLVQGDWGRSSVYNRPVKEIIMEKASASILLMSVTWVVTGIFGFVLGVIAAMEEGKRIDSMIKMYSLTMASAPAYWVGILLVLICSVKLGWFPVAFRSSVDSIQAVSFGDTVKHVILPVMTLSLSGIANVTLHTRQKLLEVLESEYALFAAARGETKWVFFWNHGLKNVLLPVITVQFGSFGEIFGGSVLVEKVFSYPGLGNALTMAGIKGDIPLLVGISLCSAVFVFMGNMMADIFCSVVGSN